MFTAQENPETAAASAGQSFRDMRQAAGVRAATVARNAGVSVSHLSRFETGQRQIAPATYWRLIGALASAMREPTQGDAA